MLKKILQITAIAVMLGAAPLVAFRSVGYASTSTGSTLSWTGQGSDSVKACTSDQTPFLHWIFTTGGGSVTAANLTVGGFATGGGAMAPHSSSDKSSWTLDTGYTGTSAPTTSTVSATVAYTGTIGNAQLVISDGCFGSEGGGGGGQMDCDNDTDNSPASDCTTVTPATDCDGDTDSSPASDCTTATTGGQGGGQVLGSNTTATVSVTPQGGVNAGAGGGSALSLGSL